MRRYKKKELLETADMLIEANEVIGRLCKSNTDRALEILGQCQESAILLGNLIESKGDGYAELVEILENYCENIYQMSLALSDDEQIRKLSKKIQKQLTFLNNRIRLEIPEDIKEVVFFPYKASMWDSLESVWMAADADEGTDAYVVPIPYYDKNPDGTFREMHYEGNEYPDYVPITNYEEYDFEERRPDIMFIHNPYDEFNYVTSVHPRFYSKNLKQYTEKLVYIPYFILSEVDPEDDAAIEGIKHFCINEAVNNADKVIVQSEDMRQVYIKVLTQESGGSREARAYWEKKIDGSGSPKVDKVLRTNKEDVEIPKEWLRVIQKPDGSFKKIVFYNTSVTALLGNSERVFEKIEFVFRIFKEKQNEVALLWRPHPLMEATIRAMRLDLWTRYRNIVEKYKNETWGIYDDSEDLNRAVAIADIYYGDGSSVANLFQEANKFAMCQNIWCPKIEDWRKSIRTSNDAIIDNDDLWVVSDYTNVLLNYDMSKGILKGIYYFPEEIIDTYFSVSFIKAEDTIFFAPYNSKKLWSFHIPTKQFEVYDLMLGDKEKNEKKKFGIIIYYGNGLLLVGHKIRSIYYFDLEIKKVRKYDEYINILAKKGIKSDETLLGYNYVIVDDILFIPMLTHNIIVSFDLLNHYFEVYEVGDLITKGFETIGYLDNQFILTNNRGDKIIWSYKSDKTKIKRLGMLESEIRSYKTVIQYEELSVYFAAYEKKIILENSKGELGRIPFSYPEAKLFPDGVYSKFEFIKKVKDRVYFQVRSNGDCFYLDLKQMVINPLNLEVPEKIYEEIVCRLFDSNDGSRIVIESEVVNIINYLSFIGQKQVIKNRGEQNEGEKIFRNIK